eukprot:COSAG05_NODE_18343_length_309_cov_8.314286_1_plen_48_part_10
MKPYLDLARMLASKAVESNRGKPPVKKKSVQRACKKQKVCTIHADFLR